MIKKILLFTLLSLSILIFSQEVGEQYENMYNAVLSNNLDQLKILINECEDINIITKDGHHVFESIFIMNNCDAAEIFILSDLDLDFKNIDGKSLRQLIKNSKNKKLLSLL